MPARTMRRWRRTTRRHRPPPALSSTTIGPIVRGGVPARLRRRFATGGSARPLRGSAAVQEVADDGKDDECCMAHQADFLCRFYTRPNDQSRPGALHGQADGREDDRDRGKPPGADLTPRCDHEPDPGGTRRLRPHPGPRSPRDDANVPWGHDRPCPLCAKSGLQSLFIVDH